MRLLLPISVSLWLLAWQPARAQTADDFFNSGAHSYISNNIPGALGVVEKGLKQYPDDAKLKKLYELLKQQNKQQSQNNKQSQQNQQKQSQQQKSQDNRNNQKENQEKNQQSQNQSEQQKKQQQEQSSAREKQKEQQKPAQAAAARQMSPQEARRLLDAQKGDEQFLQMQPKGKPRNPPAEDW